MTSLESIATLGFQNGIVKYVAEIKEDKCALKNYCLLFYKFSVCCCRFECCFISLATFWNQKIFGTNYQYQSVFKVLVSLTLVRHLHLLIAVLNGLGSFKKSDLD
jgi:PST family polysaccharide transporter